MSSNLRGEGHIDFGGDPVGGIGISMTFSCLHNILWTSGWILTKFSWLYNLDVTKNWLDFGDLDLIFKVTAVEKLKIRGWGTSVFSENTVTSFSKFLWKKGKQILIFLDWKQVFFLELNEIDRERLQYHNCKWVSLHDILS